MIGIQVGAVSFVDEGVEKVRRLETQSDPDKRRQLAKSQWIFRKNPENHTERELDRLQQMDWAHLMTAGLSDASGAARYLPRWEPY